MHSAEILLCVQVFAEAYQAFELSGLNHQDRNDRLQVLRRLLSAAIYDDIHNVHVNHTAGNLLGFPKRLLMVLLERGLPYLFAIYIYVPFRCWLACALNAPALKASALKATVCQASAHKCLGLKGLGFKGFSSKGSGIKGPDIKGLGIKASA